MYMYLTPNLPNFLNGLYIVFHLSPKLDRTLKFSKQKDIKWYRRRVS